METLLPRFVPRQWEHWQHGDEQGRLLQDTRLDLETGRAETEWTFQLGGRERSARSSQRIYTCRELREVLQSAGFGTFTHLAAGTDREFRVGDPRMWLVARA